MKSSSTGIQGNMQCPPTMMAFKPSCATDIYATRRVLEGDTHRELAALATTYDQTLICLTSSVNTVTWDISSASFPTYNKDHALNDDTNFDSSSFDTLKTKLINGGVSLSTFTYSFSAVTSKIALAFNDYTYSSKLTVVALNRDSCPDGNVLPLNPTTLESVGITQASMLTLDPMEEWLIVFPLLFCAFGVAFGAIVKLLEVKIEKERIRRLKKIKEFIREDGSVDRIQYLKDLYNVIKYYISEVGDEDPLKALIENENSEVERRQQTDTTNDIEIVLREFFDDLRFNDGELVEEKALGESTDQSENQGTDGEGDTESEEHQHDNELMMDEGEEDEEESNDVDPLDLDELLIGDDRIDEKDEEDDDEEDKDVEAILMIKKENERKCREYEESLKKLGLSEDEKRQLMEKFEDSLRRAREMMEGDAESQEKKRLKKLEERRNRRLEGKQKLKELEEKEKEISHKYEDRVAEIDKGIEARIADINDELQTKEDKERKDLEEKLRERSKKFKEIFYEKIKGTSGNNQKKLIADFEKDNEALLNDIERERAYQEKKLLKNRDKRRKKMIEESTKDLKDIKKDILKDQAREQEEIERQKFVVIAQYGLEDDMYSKGASKNDEVEEQKRASNRIKEIELIRLKQKQRFEKDFEDLIDSNVNDEMDESNKVNDEIEKEKEDFRRRIAEATNDVDKQKLLKELEEKQQDWEEEFERQRRLQDQQLFERKKRRKLYKERSNFKLNAKHRDENLKKELELMEFEAFKRENEALEMINKTLVDKKGNKELPLILYKMIEDMINDRLNDQEKIQFYELSGMLSNLYTTIAFDKALVRKNLEEDMNDKVKDLDARNVSSEEFKKEITRFQKELDKKGKNEEQELIRKQMEGEMELREHLKEKHYNDKKTLEEGLHEIRENILKQLARDYKNEGLLKLLLNRGKDELDEKLLKIAEEKENEIQKIKFQLVAKNKKDLAEMEKKLEEDLAKEKRSEEVQFEKKKKKIIKDLKQSYLDGLKSREHLNKDEKEQLLKKHEEEIRNFEAALSKEKERQFRKMREKLILKRLETEKEKEHKRRKARINRQMKEEGESDDEGNRRRKKKGRGKNANLLRQLTDVVSERMKNEYDDESVIPRKHSMNINVMLRGFKDSVTAKQEKVGKFDPAIYLRYKGDHEDEEEQYRRLQTDDVTMKSEATVNQEEAEATRLLRRIIRVEKISGMLSDSKAQQVINDLNKLQDALKRK
uniref:Uncharacterized protein n=1 Tax=Euplotes harpa TaxID=151035 RepID=A0A7S3JI35_9SPIT|mmetsp:Transcript_41805/g.48293  ORF Transcript_41805/g.48293 Transcript_41805/m.48293 type:complete len:1229 (+) Transcript_41805:4818-8504(+)